MGALSLSFFSTLVRVSRFKKISRNNISCQFENISHFNLFAAGFEFPIMEKFFVCLVFAMMLTAVCGRPIQIDSDEKLTAESVERVATVEEPQQPWGDAGSGNRMRRSIPIFCPFGLHDCFDHLHDHPRPLVTTEAPTTEPAWLRIQDRLLDPPTTSTSTTKEPTTTPDLWEEIWEAFTEETWL